jgi:hypothetical protein
VQDLQQIVERFIAGAVQPAVFDPGEEPLALVSGQWNFSIWNGRLMFEAWNAERNLVRRISGLKEERRDRIALVTERFPKTEGELQIADLAAPLGRELGKKTSRAAFRERFHLMLSRQYPQGRVEEVSVEPNLEASLSSSWARAMVRMGSGVIAAVAAPPDTPDCGGIVPAGLIWLDYLRRREKNRNIRNLVLYVPRKREHEAALRAAWLDPVSVHCELLAYDDRDRAGLIDLEDAGNVNSALPACRRPILPNSSVVHPDDLPDGVVSVEQSDGSASLQVRGLEFARVWHDRLTCGIARKTRGTAATARLLARELARVRNSQAGDRQHPLFLANPEGWLESLVRAQPEAVDASLRSVPVYGQVPVFSGPDRGVVDLLGIDHTGRLAVIEIKATADLQLPFQALDYWLRVNKHLQAGDFERLGYFAGHTILQEAPRIILVAPALEFHSTTEVMLAALRPMIEVTRVGIAADWRKGLRVMFRLKGAEKP